MSTKIDTWMPLYICDFIGGTLHLSLEEQAAYLRMLMHAWKNRGELPDDDQRLLRITGMTQGSWKKAKAALRAFFYVSDSGALRQTRLDSELERAHAQVNQRSEAGKASAAKRKAEREEQRQLSTLEDVTAPADTAEVPTAPAIVVKQDATTVATNPATNVERTSQREPQRNGIQSPSPKQTTSIHHQSSSPSTARERDDFVATDWGQWRTFFQDECGVTIEANNLHDRKKFMPLATGWLTAGVSFGQMRAAIAKARAEAKEAIAYLPGYVDRVLASMSAPASRSNPLDTKWNFEHLDRSSDIAAMEACIAYHGIVMPETFSNLDFAGNPMPEFEPVARMVTERDFEHIPIPDDFPGVELGSKQYLLGNR